MLEKQYEHRKRCEILELSVLGLVGDVRKRLTSIFIKKNYICLYLKYIDNYMTMYCKDGRKWKRFDICLYSLICNTIMLKFTCTFTYMYSLFCFFFFVNSICFNICYIFSATFFLSPSHLYLACKFSFMEKSLWTHLLNVQKTVFWHFHRALKTCQSF